MKLAANGFGSMTPVSQPPTDAPQLFVVVDTEEEFDWSAPFSREAVGVTAIAEVGRLQAILAPYRITPTYVVDYPIAATDFSARRLSELAKAGDCHIGAHLHPWVNPPHLEALSARTSYACNLGASLEHDKIERLTEAIGVGIGVVPRAYKAGRYGFGATTARIVEQLGFDVDLSVNPHMDFSSDGGPTFEAFEPVPFVFGHSRRLLELPCTTGFIGTARRFGRPLHRAASKLETFRGVGVLARSGALNKVMLSPEGNTFTEMRALTETLYRSDGVRTFALTLHSPSLKPGCTEYVRTAADRDAFLATIDRYCEFFCGTLDGVPTTPAGLYDQYVRPRVNQGDPTRTP